MELICLKIDMYLENSTVHVFFNLLLYTRALSWLQLWTSELFSVHNIFLKFISSVLVKELRACDKLQLFKKELKLHTNITFLIKMCFFIF